LLFALFRRDIQDAGVWQVRRSQALSRFVAGARRARGGITSEPRIERRARRGIVCRNHNDDQEKRVRRMRRSCVGTTTTIHNKKKKIRKRGTDTTDQTNDRRRLRVARRTVPFSSFFLARRQGFLAAELKASGVKAKP
jgi:hypothetical protein